MNNIIDITNKLEAKKIKRLENYRNYAVLLAITASCSNIELSFKHNSLTEEDARDIWSEDALDELEDIIKSESIDDFISYADCLEQELIDLAVDKGLIIEHIKDMKKILINN